jgi:hypothetical protein
MQIKNDLNDIVPPEMCGRPYLRAKKHLLRYKKLLGGLEK